MYKYRVFNTLNPNTCNLQVNRYILRYNWEQKQNYLHWRCNEI